MINICAKIENNIVVKLTAAMSVIWCENKFGGLWAAVPNNLPVGIGWTYENNEFIAPPQPECEEENE